MNLITGLTIAMTLSAPAEPYDFDTLWNYDQPAQTEAALRALLPQAEAADRTAYHAELLTQIARTLGLQQQFDAAHEILDKAELMLEEAGDRARVRYLLERGRAYRSSGKAEASTPLFEEAWDRANAGAFDFHAVDAAHMLGIMMPGDQGMEWNRKAISRAKGSEDPRAQNWLGSLYNNQGWAWFDAKEYDFALESFARAVLFREEQNKPRETLIARWCVAKTLRFQGETDAALTILRELLKAWDEVGKPDGYVYEEIGECLLLNDQPQEAAPHFHKAYELLSDDIWISRDEPERLQRLKDLGAESR